MRSNRIVLAACLLAAATPTLAETVSLTVPIVISTPGLAGSFYTSELALTNRGTTPATVTFTYTAAFGGGGGSATDTLAPGRQKVVPDAIEYLVSLNLPIPASGARGGVLRVDFDGLSRADAGAVTVRTTTAVPNGQAGLSYAAFRDGLDGAAYLCGLRQDTTDRSNVALLNSGAPGQGDVTLRVTAFSGDPAAPVSRSLPDLTLAPGAFHQYNEILKEAGLAKGYVRVDRIAGRAPYYAYATILNQVTSDGSFVPPLSEDEVYSGPGLTLPVAVETAVFSTEIVITNVSDVSKSVQLSYVADAVQAPENTAAVTLSLAPREQRVLPSLVQFLRERGVAGVGAPGPTFAGALYLKTLDDATGGVFLGGRTQTTGGDGRYGLFYTATANGAAATETAWVYGLQQNGENRTNLALINTGEAGGSGVDLHIDLFDGTTGQVARSFDVSLGARRWTQVNTVLAPDILGGYARITRAGGTNRFLAYGVVVDGGAPNSGRSDDGAFVSQSVEAPPDSPEIAAIRKVEARYVELLAQGLKQLPLVRAIGEYMATLPEYDVTGIVEEGLTAYGIFRSGRPHLVGDNREFDAGPAPPPPAAGRRDALAGKTELPEQPWARLLHSFGDTAFTQEPVYDLAGWLEDPGGYGIRPGKRGDARLSVLRSIAGDGFLYFNTHGGPYRKTREATGQYFFSLQSSTLCSTENDRIPEIKADLDAGLLTYFTERNFRRRTVSLTGMTVDDVDTRYGITAGFVRAHWGDLSTDSIIFVNACYGGRTDGGTLGNQAAARDFIDACLSKKADVYLGWSDLANSGTCFDTVRFFVDRLIGAKKFMRESPDQRAFAWELVYEDLKRAGLAHDNQTGADLIAFPGGGDSSVILDPSIKEMLVNEYDETLIIKGLFGTRRGKVTIGPGELPMAIKSWDWDTIVCNLDRTGPKANGDVIVQVPGAYGAFRKSNVHQLTEWNIPLHYFWPAVFDIAGLKIEGTGKLRFRADVGSYREKPHEPPTFPLRGMVPTKDSSLPLTGSGVGTSGECSAELIGGSVVFPAETAVGSPFGLLIAAAAKVDTNTPHLGAVGLGFGIAAGGGPFKVRFFGGPNCTAEVAVPLTMGELDGQTTFPQEGGYPAIPLFALNVTWDGQFHLPAKSHTIPELGVIVEWTTDVIPQPPVRFDLAR